MARLRKYQQTQPQSQSLRSINNNGTGSNSGRGWPSPDGDFAYHYRRRGRSHHVVYYALKSIHLRNVSSELFAAELRNEVSILGSLDHPNIVRAIETYEHGRRLYLVLELCTGGDLYARDPYTENRARRIVGSILSAVAYMHGKGIVHRDLKYENVMFVNSEPDSDVKLIDFGLSKKYRPGDPFLKTGVGTIYSMAPEVFGGEYTSQADVWGVGVMAYMLLSSHLPFYGKKRQDIISRIVHGKYHFKGRRWRGVSNEAKSFVATLLQKDPKRRPTSAQALNLPWLKKRASPSGRSTAEERVVCRSPDCSAEQITDEIPDKTSERRMLDEAVAALRNYASYPAIKKLALMVIAHRSTDAEIGPFLRNLFHELDERSGERAGVVSESDFKACLTGEYGYGEEDLEGIFAGVDLGSNGMITYTEFLAATIESSASAAGEGNGISTNRMTEAFDHFDNDGCGFISVADLRAVLGENISSGYVDRVIDEADLTEDHRISFEEFLSLWC